MPPEATCILSDSTCSKSSRTTLASSDAKSVKWNLIFRILKKNNMQQEKRRLLAAEASRKVDHAKAEQ